MKYVDGDFETEYLSEVSTREGEPYGYQVPDELWEIYLRAEGHFRDVRNEVLSCPTVTGFGRLRA